MSIWQRRNQTKWGLEFKVYLPSKTPSKFKSENTSSNPAEKTHKSGQRSSSLVKKYIQKSIKQSKQEPKIQNEASIEPTWAFGKRIEGRSVIEEHERSEEDWPDEENMDENISWVAVISPIECKMPLEIQQSTPSHWNLEGIESNGTRNSERNGGNWNGCEKGRERQVGIKGKMRIWDWENRSKRAHWNIYNPMCGVRNGVNFWSFGLSFGAALKWKWKWKWKFQGGFYRSTSRRLLRCAGVACT